MFNSLVDFLSNYVFGNVDHLMFPMFYIFSFVFVLSILFIPFFIGYRLYVRLRG